MTKTTHKLPPILPPSLPAEPPVVSNPNSNAQESTLPGANANTSQIPPLVPQAVTRPGWQLPPQVPDTPLPLQPEQLPSERLPSEQLPHEDSDAVLELATATGEETSNQKAELQQLDQHDAIQPQNQPSKRKRSLRQLVLVPVWLLGRIWDMASLSVLLAFVAAIPIVQFASLGYLLTSASNLAQRKPWATAFPGLRLAGRLGTFALLATLLWLPVWLVTDLSYSAQLLQPGSRSAGMWRFGAFVISFAWVAHISWAAMRGGRWWNFLWPAPIRMAKQIFSKTTWHRASDDLYTLVTSLHFPQLWWLGARAALGAFLWTCIPVSLLIIGIRADGAGLAPVGLLGALLMVVVALYLPHLQVHMAMENRLGAILEIGKVRMRFRYAPIAHSLSLFLLFLLCTPVYLIRIEATPAELVWAPSLVFIVLMLPAKIALGASIGYAEGRQHARRLPVRHWTLRWPARLFALASVVVYVILLNVAQLFASQGAIMMYFQHAFLAPLPLVSS